MSNNGDIASGRIQSGLTRSFSAFAAFLFGIHCISLSSSGFIPYSWVASVWPGADILGVLTLAAVCCLFHGVTYAIIGGTIPATGSDYVFSSRVVSPLLSFAASWTLVLFSGVVAGGLAAWVPKSAIPALVRPMAIIWGDYRYNFVADFATSALGSFSIGLALIIFVVMTVLRSNLFIQRLLAVGFVFGLVAWIIILASLFMADGPRAFEEAWNRFMSTPDSLGAFNQRIPLAEAAGMNVSNSVSAMTLAGLIMGFWIFYGYYIPTFFAEEVQSPTRSLLIASTGSLVFSYVIFAAGAILLLRLVPSDWIAAEGYIFNNPDSVAAVSEGRNVVAMPWITFYASILNPRPILIYIMAFGWIFTLVNLVQTYFFYSSRIIYSWSLDRVVPDWVLGSDPADPKPTRSILIMALLATIGLIDASFGGPLGTQLTFAFFAVVVQLVPIFAITFLPILSPEMFKRVPSAFRKRILGIPISSLFGGITLLYLLWMVVASFLYPAVGVANPFTTVLLLLAFLISGMVVFVLMRSWRRREDIDIALTYKGIPSDAKAPQFE